MCNFWNLSSSPPYPNIGAGFFNLGNTCFLNAALQCLVHTVPLAYGILHSRHSVVCQWSGEGDGFCSVCALGELIANSILYSGEHSVAPFNFVKHLSDISVYLKHGVQEDAQEFIQSLLNHLHDCWLEPIRRDLWPSLQEESLIREIFGGKMRSQLLCVECGHKSATFEPTLEISLEINNGVHCLTDVLRSFTAVERMEDALFTCGGCMNRVSMDEQLSVEKAPEVLVIHLKRFQYTKHGFLNKIDRVITYPFLLDIRSFVNQPAEDANLNYNLYAVLVHMGLPSFGHYIAYIHSLQRAWYRMDDRKVTKVSSEEALSQEAYLLFYVNNDTTTQFHNFMELEKEYLLGRSTALNQRDEEESSEATSWSFASWGHSSDEESSSDSMDLQGKRVCSSNLPPQQNRRIYPGAATEITGNLSEGKELMRPNAKSFDHCSSDEVRKSKPCDDDSEKHQEAQDQEERTPSDSEVAQDPESKAKKEKGP